MSDEKLVQYFISETNKKFDEVDKRFDEIQQMLGDLKSFRFMILGVAAGVSGTVSFVVAILTFVFNK